MDDFDVNARGLVGAGGPGRQVLASPWVAALVSFVVACGDGAERAALAPSVVHAREVDADEVSRAHATADLAAQIVELEALGYAGASPIDDLDAPTGVVHHDRERAEPGLNLVASGHGPEALL